MADEWGEDDATRRAKAALITTTVPNAARVADYLYGGQNNFEADRKAARARAARAPPQIATPPPPASPGGPPPRGRAGHRPRVPHRLRGQRPDGALARPGADEVRATRSRRLRRRGRPRRGLDRGGGAGNPG